MRLRLVWLVRGTGAALWFVPVWWEFPDHMSGKEHAIRWLSWVTGAALLFWLPGRWFRPKARISR